MAYKLLFVCLGNICRSPAAENIMNHLIEQSEWSQSSGSPLRDRIICDSAGTSSYHIGSPPDRRMSVAAAQKLGIKMRGRARQFQELDFQDFDLILAMDRENYEDILYLDPTGQHHHKVRLMCDFCSRHTLKEVPDPYYGGAEGFERVIDLLVDACEGLLEYVISLETVS
ncbi:low molecular weight protein-tyrosine-phosphatase [Chlorogloeopsis sp. ULAP01]|uniref:low molecular weight protein-tyrosine-phosphatase n=1 Tax=Chlorogloeopsis sp. ULAP01 TaxID=3056483 RepID=UPI0025AA7A43|nr:low molecular weight protein-tyrosine-phosphatase [Chlorogloeopsis sp. ULAP01]MDM9385466.1 low molecular weight protein-tyrosine-phosphatase [Chlorogloeopsis sp. ULAP01]